MRILSILTFAFSLLFSSTFAQTYEKPFVGTVGDQNCFISKVDLSKEQTVITFSHLNNNGWIALNPDIHINTPDGKKYRFLKAEGIPIAPEQYNFSENEKEHTFKVYFNAIPKSVKKFDVIEVESGSRFDFNFYGVDLAKKRTSDTQVSRYPEEVVVDTAAAVATSANPFDFMGNLGEVYKDIYKSAVDSYLNYLKQPGKLKELAKLNKAFFDALLEEGFTKEQALQILLSTPLIPTGITK
ncbi:hypothetical protein [Desertivirga arenae]|uniref:hypothetical protein n=1 Tax=Desertivirga arenae TaxID=2810309 RepID=UPI001A976D1E|nr:hypothetical protein [Pedobacter sp. SYSU D00823]